MALATLNWGTGVAETSLTLGTSRLDYRTPPTAYHLYGSQITQLVNYAIATSQYDLGGNRRRILPTSTNQFAVGEYGIEMGTTSLRCVFNGGTAQHIATSLVQAVTYSATPTWDPAAGNYVTMTLTGNITPTITTANLTSGQIFTVQLTQDGTGGRTCTWPAAVKLAGGALTLSGANKVDVITFRWGGTYLREISRALNQA